MPDQPWYAGGLRFQCTQCGDCCTGAPGYVWVNKDEIAALAEAVDEADIEKFEALYVRKVGIRKSLKEYSDGACVFFDSETRRCTVYTSRPRQCRTWPFWESNLRTLAAWQQTCEVCPGSGRGELYELEEIEARRQEVRV